MRFNTYELLLAKATVSTSFFETNPVMANVADGEGLSDEDDDVLHDDNGEEFQRRRRAMFQGDDDGEESSEDDIDEDTTGIVCEQLLSMIFLIAV